MIRIEEVIVVEGKYDKNTLAQIVDAVILETSGFQIFSDREKLNLLRRLAEKRGIILLTDSDSAGFLIRNHLKGALPKDRVKQAYIPDISGKERRKASPSKEGKLGVEGMSREVLYEALVRAGATFSGTVPEDRSGVDTRRGLTIADFYEAGLTGTPNSSERRKAVLKKLNLPERLSASSMLEVLNALFSPEEFAELVRQESTRPEPT